MKITSTAFNTGEKIPSVYTCDGKDTNPTLVFSDVSESAKSLVLIMDDPDAPAGTFVHWVVYNIDPQTEKVVENSVPESGIQGATSAGDSKYHGPCPPSGTHRYFFKLYALDIVLSVPENTNKRSLIDAMNGHVIANAELIGLYGRSQ
ncbi:MAG: hypothetical protein A2857_05435 [Candidatus Levybacteria bacterium RIFCSPHIGHO2_01_FULL_36_15]|nr:MAG: hypothetical protein A2857_05435 [Candidatus Levybacteria bacterium RIFCSPHIGHO2_01_FULL_36_15]OGH38508.1 MAG: hypothetical protein A2905_01965 [Candidatus Levybacteria bacterium RIFCSPLOWO2_01_FULL_36_10]